MDIMETQLQWHGEHFKQLHYYFLYSEHNSDPDQIV